jgi:all-trans-retinol 13,14-reductase
MMPIKPSDGDYYDIIVIGAGAGGLTTAALLAKAGKKVLLVEKETRIGGLISPLVYGPHHFDVGPRLLMGCNQDGPFGPGTIYTLLDHLGVADQCEFIPVQPFVSVRLPGTTFHMWSGRQAFLEGMEQSFTTGLENLPQLLDMCNRLYVSGKIFALAKKPWGLLKTPSLLLELFGYRNTTLGDVLNQYIPELRSRVALGTLWPYLGLAPERASFIFWAMLMATFIEEGSFYCKGGLHQVADAIAGAFTRQGGELLLSSEVTGVIVENRSVTGARLANGREVFTPIIVSTVDPRSVFGGLIDANKIPRDYYRRLKSFETSHAGINISLVTDLDLPAMGFGFETLVFDNWDTDQIQRNPTIGQVGMFTLTITTVADASLASPGQHLVSAFTGLPEGRKISPEDRSKFGAVLFAEVKKHIPQLEDHLILASNGGHPEGYLTHEFGPIYGWASSPRQSGLGRLGQQTPLKGLYLAGHWTQPSQGVMPVMLSGMALVKTILG